MLKKLSCCVLTLLLIIVVLVCGAVGMGVYSYNQYVKPYISLSFTEAVGALFNLYGIVEEKIVTNPFNATEAITSLNGNMRKALYISEGTEFDIKDMIKALLNKTNDEGVDATTYIAGVKENPNEENGFIKMLEGLDFDFSSLENYNGEKVLMDITDKETGAMLEMALEMAVKPYLEEMTSSYGIDVNALISVKQAIFRSDTGVLDKNSAIIDATVKVDLNHLLVKLIELKAPSLQFLSGLLPKNLYFTLSIMPYGEGLPRIDVNGNDKLSKDFLAIINGYYNYTGGVSGQDKISELLSTVDGYFKKTFVLLDDYLEVNFADTVINVNPVQSLIKALNLVGVSDTDMQYMISYMIKDYDDVSQIVWDAAVADEFFVEFMEKMPIDESLNVNMDNFTDVFDKIGNNIDVSRLEMNKSSDELRVDMNYDALAGIVNKYLSKSESSSKFLKYVETRYIEMHDVAKQEGKLTVELDLKKYIEDSGLNSGITKKIINAIAQEKMYISMVLSLDENAPIKIEDVDFRINDLNIAQSDQLLDVFSKLLSSVSPSVAEELNKTNIVTHVQDIVFKSIKELNKQEVGAGLKIEFGEDGVVLPSVYEIMYSQYKFAPEDDMTPDDIRITLYKATDQEGVKDNVVVNPLSDNVAPSEFGFTVKKNNELKLMNGLINGAMSDTSIANEVSVKLNTTEGGGLFGNVNIKASVKQFNLSDFANVDANVNNKLLQDNNINHMFNAYKTANSRIMMATAQAEFIWDAASENNSMEQVVKLFREPIYVSLVVDMAALDSSAHAGTPPSTVFVNCMTEKESRQFETIVKKIGGVDDFSFDTLTDKVVTKLGDYSIDPDTYSVNFDEEAGEGDTMPNNMFSSHSLKKLMNDETTQYINIGTDQTAIAKMVFALDVTSDMGNVYGLIKDGVGILDSEMSSKEFQSIIEGFSFYGDLAGTQSIVDQKKDAVLPKATLAQDLKSIEYELDDYFVGKVVSQAYKDGTIGGNFSIGQIAIASLPKTIGRNKLYDNEIMRGMIDYANMSDSLVLSTHAQATVPEIVISETVDNYKLINSIAKEIIPRSIFVTVLFDINAMSADANYSPAIIINEMYGVDSNGNPYANEKIQLLINRTLGNETDISFNEFGTSMTNIIQDTKITVDETWFDSAATIPPGITLPAFNIMDLLLDNETRYSDGADDIDYINKNYVSKITCVRHNTFPII